jgi:hypothetical protein
MNNCSDFLSPSNNTCCNRQVLNNMTKIKFNQETKECFDLLGNFLGYGTHNDDTLVITQVKP